MARHRTVTPRTAWLGKTAAAAVLTLTGMGLGLVAQGVATADPITCPAGQTAAKTATGWDCVNGGGNTSNAEDPRNPNAGKGDF